MTNLYTRIQNKTLGELLLLSDGQVLTGLYFADKPHAPELDHSWFKQPSLDLFVTAEKQLQEYLAGKRQIFTVPYYFTDGTPFQRQVWQALTQIPFGTTQRYKVLANLIARPNSVRAVAAAIARNPFSIIVPCHRVIGSDGSLTGYAGGLERKKLLLSLERACQRTTS